MRLVERIIFASAAAAALAVAGCNGATPSNSSRSATAAPPSQIPAPMPAPPPVAPTQSLTTTTSPTTSPSAPSAPSPTPPAPPSIPSVSISVPPAQPAQPPSPSTPPSSVRVTLPVARRTAPSVQPARWVYAAESATGLIDQYSVDPTTGGLTFVASTPESTANDQIMALATDPLGRFLFVGNYQDIRSCTLDPQTGALTPVGAGPVATGLSLPWALEATPNGKFLLVTDSGNDTVNAFSIDSQGNLALVSTVQLPSGSTPGNVAIDLTGSIAYVAITNAVGLVTIGASGNLAAGATVSIGSGGPSSLAVTPDGTVLYVSTAGGGVGTSAGSIVELSVTPGVGQPTPLATLQLPYGSVANLEVDPGQRYLSALDTLDQEIGTATIDPTTGVLTLAAVVSTASYPANFGLAIDPTGDFAYALEVGNGSLQTFGIAPATGAVSGGALTPTASGVAGEPVAVVAVE